MNRQALAILSLVSVAFAAFQYVLSQGKHDDTIYPIREHGIGTWYAIDVPLPVNHKTEMPYLTDYGLTLTFDIRTHENKPPEPHLRVAVTAVFKFGGENRNLPGTTHVQLVIDGKTTRAFPLKVFAVREDGEQQKEWLSVAMPLAEYRAIVAAEVVEGRVYWLSQNGEEVRQHDLRTFKLDQKAMRSLKALDLRVHQAPPSQAWSTTARHGRCSRHRLPCNRPSGECSRLATEAKSQSGQAANEMAVSANCVSRPRGQ